MSSIHSRDQESTHKPGKKETESLPCSQEISNTASELVDALPFVIEDSAPLTSLTPTALGDQPSALGRTGREREASVPRLTLPL